MRTSSSAAFWWPTPRAWPRRWAPGRWPSRTWARRRISAIKIPALINGGSHVGTPQGMLRTVSDALGAGAAGVLFGPAFLGTKSPNVVSKVLGEMIMGGKSLQEAKDLHPLTE